jgi:hypothetical protein
MPSNEDIGDINMGYSEAVNQRSDNTIVKENGQ